MRWCGDRRDIAVESHEAYAAERGDGQSRNGGLDRTQALALDDCCLVDRDRLPKVRTVDRSPGAGSDIPSDAAARFLPLLLRASALRCSRFRFAG
jgi:hypothetical protein